MMTIDENRTVSIPENLPMHRAAAGDCSDSDHACRFEAIVAELLYRNQVLRFELQEALQLVARQGDFS